MNLRFDNLFVLFGLFALAVPVLLHLLQRRRFDILDWGAIQFLPDSISAHQRRWLDELLLMFVRLGMMALIVLALATPISTSAWLDGLGGGRTRDIVLIFDGAHAMGVRVPNQVSPWDDAIQQAIRQIDDATPGDRFAILIARQSPHWHLEEFSGDFDEVRARIQSLPLPRGNPSMPSGLAEAWNRLQARTGARAKEIRVFTDMRRHSWTAAPALAAFDSLAGQWHADLERAKIEGAATPSLRVVTVGANLPKTLLNYVLSPLTVSSRVAKVGQRVTIQSALHLDAADKFIAPRGVRVFIDGKLDGELTIPGQVEAKQGQIALSHMHRFMKEGQYVVSFVVAAEPANDVLSADSEQHAIVEVVKDLPVLLVDGDRQLSSESSSFFLMQALASKNEKTKNAAAVSYSSLKPDAFLPSGPNATRPAVVVLADVPTLAADQLDALTGYVAEGGGLFIALGERAAREQAFYNQQVWMPAKLVGVGVAKDGVQPESRKFQHPALERFRDGNMPHVRFSHWTQVKLVPNDRAAVVGSLSNGEPLFIEKPFKAGRVMLATVPVDRRWDSTLPSASEFPIMMHEWMYFLAGGNQGTGILSNGVPIQLAPGGVAPGQLTLKTPETDGIKIDVAQWPWTYGNTGAIGVYQARAADGRAWSFVVPPDLDGSNLTRCSADDVRQVRARLPIAWHADTSEPTIDADGSREELWWLFLAAVLGLLCLEVWMTRRLVIARGR